MVTIYSEGWDVAEYYARHEFDGAESLQQNIRLKLLQKVLNREVRHNAILERGEKAGTS